ncbi:MAG: DUF2383 domain-containing protein [Verrucomicrobiales bacterium]|nr:DUF2383 domain-containing protein [Verrucomicrobiales bacterium]
METTLTEPKSEMHEDCIEWCNKLLRGERSAVETYQMAIDKHHDNPALTELNDIRAEHHRSVTELEANIREMGGEPDQDSGVWGVFAKAVQGGANLFGEESAIEALENGEKKGLDDYEDALESGELMPGCAILYREKLIPRIKSHLLILDRLEERVD